ncbi:MAG: hypothetical protein QNJ46_32760 [Leptolyngbyaceae cyanobacterium MO_188.B28]|nr:hypothetical protein [Leptolyngbyaceae cyanobacterium MO_188.B28]
MRCRPLAVGCFYLMLGSGAAFSHGSAIALPQPEDPPEEILRTEIIIEARSPINGAPLTAAEYAELQTQLQAPPENTSVSSDIQELIFLLQIRRVIRPILPFIP